ncbi:MAG: hypothetical protein JNM56_36780 [Planctomycetia bacterium]|nr:hypothetical protein [Planctomycetia bacterium]
MNRCLLALGLLFSVVVPAATQERPGDELAKLREALGRAAEALKAPEKQLPQQFRAPQPDGLPVFQQTLVSLQKDVGLAEYHLEACLDELNALKDERDRAPQRWQALYDFTSSRLLLRMAVLNEYNWMLGRMRKDELPERDPTQHDTWQLSPRERPSSRDSDKFVRRARELLRKLVDNHPGTPWELLARRELLGLEFLGLEWQPIKGR